MPDALARPALCIFDLDGTLVDSLRDIAEALNECLELLGVATHPIDNYRYMVGEGVPKLCERALGSTHPQLVPRLIELARARYRARPLRFTRPYAGLPELVQTLRSRDMRLAVLSNKPHEMTVRVTRAFWPDGAFERIYGYDEERNRKPEPYFINRIGQELNVPPARIWMVGDTPTDVEAARRAGVLSIGVTWGFRTREDLAAAGAGRIIDSPQELNALVETAGSARS